MKATIKEFLEFLESDWGDPDAHYEDEDFIINGEQVTAETEFEKFPPQTIMEIKSGIIWMPNGEHKDFVRSFSSWRKRKNKRYILVEVSGKAHERSLSILKSMNFKVVAD